MTKKKLPEKLIIIKNPDKNFHEKWDKGRDKLNIPHPFRCLLLGPPNCGKTLIIKNLILRQNPEFQEVICIHCDPEYTQEYDDVEATYIDRIPTPDEFPGKKKTLVIIDDKEIKNLKKDQFSALDRLFGFVSTHKNISVCLTSQDLFNVPPIVRRCSNFFVLWKTNDLDNLSNIGKKVNIDPKKFKELFEKNIHKKTDSLWIDQTENSPYPLRVNGFDLI